MNERVPIALGDYADSIAAHVWVDVAHGVGTEPSAYRRHPHTPGRVALGIPGIYSTWRSLHLWASALYEDGWDVFLVPELEDMSAPVDDLACLVEDFIEGHDLRDIVVFAHSKGGLVAKAVMLGEQGWRIRSLIAFATPFGGAPIVKLAPLVPELQEMSPDSAEIRKLKDDHSVHRRIVQVEAQWDQDVPPTALEGARHIVMPIVGHSAMKRSAQAARTLVILANQVVM